MLISGTWTIFSYSTVTPRDFGYLLSRLTNGYRLTTISVSVPPRRASNPCPMESLTWDTTKQTDCPAEPLQVFVEPLKKWRFIGGLRKLEQSPRLGSSRPQYLAPQLSNPNGGPCQNDKRQLPHWNAHPCQLLSPAREGAKKIHRKYGRVSGLTRRAGGVVVAV